MKQKTARKIGIFSILVQTFTNLAGYVLAGFLIINSIYMECIQKIAPVLVAPTFFVGIIALGAMVLYSRFIIWSAKEFVAPMRKRNRH